MLNWLNHKLRTAREFSPADISSFMEAWCLLLYFSWSVHFTSLEKLTRSANPPTTVSIDSSHDAHKMFRLVTWASRLHVFPMTCLMQSLTLRRMLSRKGIPSDLRIGALKTDAGYRAHAWLEVRGRVIGDENLVGEGFKTLLPAYCTSPTASTQPPYTS